MYNRNEYDRLTEQFQKSMNAAADHLDTLLNDRLNGVIDHAMDRVDDALGPKGRSADADSGWHAAEKQKTTSNLTRTGAAGTVRVQTPVEQKTAKPVLFASDTWSKIRSILAIAGGGCSALIGLIVALSSLAGFGMAETAAGTAAGAVGIIWGLILFAAGIVFIPVGASHLSFAKRFEKYIQAFGMKTVAELKNLAETAGISEKKLVKDLKKMSEKKWFLQGHFDDEMQNFMVSDETYQSYLNYKENQKAIAAENAKYGLDADTRSIISEGEAYLLRIRQANDALPGEVISKKLDDLESVIRRILEEVKRQPSQAGDLKRLMTYYLPTTWKFLQAYQQIELQNPKTEQMLKTQQEIETTLDTINAAFTKLLDQLFQKQAWDISTDISVLNTLLNQDGLKDSGIKLTQEK